MIGLEPSCGAVFRSDMRELLPKDEDAERMRDQFLTLAELLEHHAPGGWEPELDTDAIVQTHCHQHAVLGFEPDTSLMRRSGVRAEVLDSGCCGLAGNFGFERGHYDISMACAEHALLPAVRQAGQETQVLADGFSCRTQIAHGSDRHAKHLAEILDGQN